MNTISIAELALWQRGGLEFGLVDVRRGRVRESDGADIPGARWLDPAAWLDWKDGLVEANAGRPLLLYCAHGHEISQGLAAALRAMGADARSLAGGYSGWKAAGEPVVPFEEPKP